MSLRQYFKAKEGLPDPGGSLSNAVPPAAIRSANREVEKALDSKRKKKSRGPYKK